MNFFMDIQPFSRKRKGRIFDDNLTFLFYNIVIYGHSFSGEYSGAPIVILMARKKRTKYNMFYQSMLDMVINKTPMNDWSCSDFPEPDSGWSCD